MSGQNLTTRAVEVKSSQSKTTVGDGNFTVIAGPCSIESEAHLLQTGNFVAEAGACLLRGGIFKMRTDPKSFQGMGSDAMPFLETVKNRVGLGLVSEITDVRQLEEMLEVVDVFQVGSRNMYNYSLLEELGRQPKPVLLKRGFSATVEEWLKAAEYLVKGGNEKIILCERGIRTFETSTRNTLDLNSVALLKTICPWPILVDPSHGTGKSALVEPLALAAAAAGADGIIVEVHPEPAKAKSDGFQALDFLAFQKLVQKLNVLLPALNRKMATATSDNRRDFEKASSTWN